MKPATDLLRRKWVSRFHREVALGSLSRGFLILTMAACISPAERFGDYTGRKMVISGQISSLEGNSFVTVAMTTITERLPEPIVGAAVRLVDDTAAETVFHEEAEGKYRLSDFTGTPGHSYFLRVTLPNGRTYESAPETMPTAIGSDDVFYTIEPMEYTDSEGAVVERHFVKVFTNHSLPEIAEPLYMRWYVRETYMISPTDFPDINGHVPEPCFVDQQVDPQRTILFSTEDIKASNIPAMELVGRVVDRSFKERHYFTIFRASLSRNAHEYWRKVGIVANQVGSIFDQPPARLMGNFHNVADPGEEVFGYFQAVHEKLSRFYLLPGDLPFGMPLHCEYREYRQYYDYPSECRNCLSVPRSSYHRPPWF